MCFWAILGGEDGSPDPSKRIIEGIGGALLEGDNRIVGDADVFRTDLGAALGDVAVTDPKNILEFLETIDRVQWVHGEGSDTAAKFLAMPRLMPLPPPVTQTVFPASSLFERYWVMSIVVPAFIFSKE